MFEVNNENIRMESIDVVLVYLLLNLNSHISTGGNHLTHLCLELMAYSNSLAVGSSSNKVLKLNKENVCFCCE